MTRRRAVPAQIDFTQHRVTPGSITLPTQWSPEQAVAVFEILDELREHVWARYGLQIQHVLRDERSTAVPAAHDIDEADVPF
ncbi:MAG: hypothetical protein WCJ87_09930 [Burkholderiales bacterium]